MNSALRSAFLYEKYRHKNSVESYIDDFESDVYFPRELAAIPSHRFRDRECVWWTTIARAAASQFSSSNNHDWKKACLLLTARTAGRRSLTARISCAEPCRPRRASESPIAIACFRLLTFLPDRPDLRVPRFISCISRATVSPAFLRILPDHQISSGHGLPLPEIWARATNPDSKEVRRRIRVAEEGGSARHDCQPCRWGRSYLLSFPQQS